MRLLSILLFLLFTIGCNVDEVDAPNDSRLVGTYVSSGGPLGLSSGDSLVISQWEIHYKDASIVGWDSINTSWIYEYNTDWISVKYLIETDSTLNMDSSSIVFYYQIYSDTLKQFCVYEENQMMISIDACDEWWGFSCCPSHWNRID